MVVLLLTMTVKTNERGGHYGCCVYTVGVVKMADDKIAGYGGGYSNRSGVYLEEAHCCKINLVRSLVHEIAKKKNSCNQHQSMILLSLLLARDTSVLARKKLKSGGGFQHHMHSCGIDTFF